MMPTRRHVFKSGCTGRGLSGSSFSQPTRKSSSLRGGRSCLSRNSTQEQHYPPKQKSPSEHHGSTGFAVYRGRQLVGLHQSEERTAFSVKRSGVLLIPATFWNFLEVCATFCRVTVLFQDETHFPVDACDFHAPYSFRSFRAADSKGRTHERTPVTHPHPLEARHPRNRHLHPVRRDVRRVPNSEAVGSPRTPFPVTGRWSFVVFIVIVLRCLNRSASGQ